MVVEHIYGMHPAFEVLRARRRRVQRAYLQEGLRAQAARIQQLTALLAAAGVPIERLPKQRLGQLCRSAEHQGVVLVADPYPYVALESIWDEPRLLLLDNVEDPQNVGAILRSAEVFGWQAVLLSARGVPEVYPSVVKAAAGATEHLRVARDHAANIYVKLLLARGFTLLALDAHGRDDIALLSQRAYAKLLLVIGGEHRSVGQHILNQAHHVAGIPQKGRIRSLNASVAAGIALCMLAR
ncbi:MAG: RNA methyltransferase [Lentisphaerae bacterium]|jgi:23S rRNA (guanosine2251-2'-O)-methyltransferase|nr:RNA methyltransferase [Lentisphaerota bacterium]